jgi:hypothetical protein
MNVERNIDVIMSSLRHPRLNSQRNHASGRDIWVRFGDRFRPKISNHWGESVCAKLNADTFVWDNGRTFYPPKDRYFLLETELSNFVKGVPP